MSEENKIRSIDLFAGIGGIRIGFEQGFGPCLSTVFVSEFDEKAQKVYSDNFHDPFELSGDITKIDEHDIPTFDICLAGFPCQAFSIAGKKMGLNDSYRGMSRGTLFYEVVRICEYHKPKVIFCENVKGLLTHNGGNTFKIIEGAFRQIGYDFYFKVLRSQDFGVPQTRERTYMVCIRRDINPLSDGNDFPWPKPIAKENNTIRSILEEEPVSAKYYLSETYLSCLERHKQKQVNAGRGFGYKIRDLDDLAGTVVCGGMGRERNLIIDKRQTNLTPVTSIRGQINKKGIRKLTPKEWARLQGFPPEYKFNESDTSAYKQLGNSVTVPVIKAIAAQIKALLKI